MDAKCKVRGKKGEKEGKDTRFKALLKKATALLMMEGALLGACGGQEFSNEDEKPAIPSKDAQAETDAKDTKDAEKDSPSEAGKDVQEPDVAEDSPYDAGEDALDGGMDSSDAHDSADDAQEADAPMEASDDALDSGDDAFDSGEDAAEIGPDVAEAGEDVLDSGVVCEGISSASVGAVSISKDTPYWIGGYGIEYIETPAGSAGINVNLYCQVGGATVKIVDKEFAENGTPKVWERGGDGFKLTLSALGQSPGSANIGFKSEPL